MLVGFFLSVGMQGLPNLPVVLTALGLVLMLPIKTWLYMVITTRFGLRARTSLFSSITLGNFSEFGLIVAALGVSQGFLSVDWLLVMALAVSASFAVAAPFSDRAEVTYHNNKKIESKWDFLFSQNNTHINNNNNKNNNNNNNLI